MTRALAACALAGSIAACAPTVAPAPNVPQALPPLVVDDPVPADARPLDAIAMRGPFAALEDFCTTWSCKAPSAGKPCGCVGVTPWPLAGAGPWLAAAVVETRAPSAPESSTLRPAVRTDAGWFVAEDAPESSTDAAMMKRYVTTARVTAMRVEDVIPGGPPELVVELASSTTRVAIDPTTGVASAPVPHRAEAATMVCLVGPTGARSCLDPIVAATLAPALPPAPPALRFTAARVLTVAAGDGWTLLLHAGHADTHESVPLAGAYVVRLP